MIHIKVENGLYLNMWKWLSIEVSLIEPFTKGLLSLVPGRPSEDHGTTEEFFKQNVYIAPVITFHGDDDLTTTPNYRPVNFPPNQSSEASTSLCLLTAGPYSTSHTSSGYDLIMIGSLSLRDLVQSQGKFAETYIDCTMGHGLDSPDGPGSGFNSNFGTVYLYEREIQVYMVQRAAVFFQSILINLSNTTATIPGVDTFIECVNTRYNKTDANNNCVSELTRTSCPDCIDECNTTKITDCP